MEKAKYFLHGVGEPDVAQIAVANALKFNDPPVSIIGADSLQSIIHPGFANAEYPWPPQPITDPDKRNAEIDKIVNFFGQPISYEWFDYKRGVYSAADGEEPYEGFVLPFRDDPKTIELKREDLPDDVTIEQVFDVEIAFADHGAPEQVHRAPGIHGRSFKRRQSAARLLGRDPKNRNKTVHVIVVDQGMDPNYIDALGGPDTFASRLWNTGVSPTPTDEILPTEHRDRYRSRPQWHAHMVVRNVLAMGGDNRGAAKPIRIYDVPVIPDRVSDVLGTATTIRLQYFAIITRVGILTDTGNDHAVIVNAWGVKNRFRETPIGDFTENFSHPLNQAILELAVKSFPRPFPPPPWKANDKSAVVFAAGNNGLFTPNPEAGQLDRGPMRSIWYPAALPFVWSAAATDRTGKWIGVSSQGPAGAIHPVPPPLDQKPDFALPSYFSEEVDSHTLNTGTSASCGLLAGMLAAHWRHRSNPPDKAFARTTAEKFGHVAHSRRLGNGVPQDDKFGP